MNVKKSTETIQKKLADLLKQHPAERKNSLGIVVSLLQEKHVAAALWMEKNLGMTMGVHNLHDLIVKYDAMEAASKATVEGDVTDLLNLAPGVFNPVHLIAYFKR